MSHGQMQVAEVSGRKSTQSAGSSLFLTEGQSAIASSHGLEATTPTQSAAIMEEWPAEAPLLLAPINSGVIVIPSNLDEKPVEFRWQPQLPTASYEFNLENEKGEAVSKGPSLPGVEINLKPGTYRWRVRRVSERGQVSRWSDYSAVAMVRPTPGVSLPPISINTRLGDSLRTDVVPIPIEWPARLGAQSYQVLVFEGDRIIFKSNFMKETRFTYLLTSVGSKALSAEVNALTDEQATLVGVPSPIHIDFVEPLLKNPLDGSVLKNLKTTPFTWESTLLTDYYQIQFARDPDFRKLLVDDKTKENFFLPRLEKAQSIIRYYWHVRSVSKSGLESPWSETRNFSF